MNSPTERFIPVFMGLDQKHVMGRAVIVREPGKVTITIESTGEAADMLGDFVTEPVPMGLSFVPIPITSRNKNPNLKETM